MVMNPGVFFNSGYCNYWEQARSSPGPGTPLPGTASREVPPGTPLPEVPGNPGGRSRARSFPVEEGRSWSKSTPEVVPGQGHLVPGVFPLPSHLFPGIAVTRRHLVNFACK